MARDNAVIVGNASHAASDTFPDSPWAWPNGGGSRIYDGTARSLTGLTYRNWLASWVC
jgi:hypothetical protein